jgi:acyl carrier protein
VTDESPFDCYRRLLVDAAPQLEGQEPGSDSRLSDLGFDSIALLGLIVQLEDAFDLNMPDEVFTPETFESVESLWLVVSALRDSAREPFIGS